MPSLESSFQPSAFSYQRLAVGIYIDGGALPMVMGCPW
jgi:hypothetical protein